MKKAVLFLSLTAILGSATINASQGSCSLCKKVNAYNKQNPQKYKYYEDYLRAVESGEEAPADPKVVLNEILIKPVTSR